MCCFSLSFPFFFLFTQFFLVLVKCHSLLALCSPHNLRHLRRTRLFCNFSCFLLLSFFHHSFCLWISPSFSFSLPFPPFPRLFLSDRSPPTSNTEPYLQHTRTSPSSAQISRQERCAASWSSLPTLTPTKSPSTTATSSGRTFCDYT